MHALVRDGSQRHYIVAVLFEPPRSRLEEPEIGIGEQPLELHGCNLRRFAGGDAHGKRFIHVALEIELDTDTGIGSHKVFCRGAIEGLALGSDFIRHEVDDAVLRRARCGEEGRQSEDDRYGEGSSLL